MNIFQTAPVPPSRRNNRMNSVARWWTWSDEFRSELPALISLARSFKLSPRIHRINGLKRYDYTFSFHHLPEGKKFRDRLAPWAESLQRINPDQEIWMMRGLERPGMTSQDIRIVFTGLRDALTPNIKDARGALYAPLGDTGGDPTEFPLHCDLYVPDRLWNVFDDVTLNTRSGASIFLRTADMLQMARECGVMPLDSRQLGSFLKSGGSDRYDQFYSLLYSNKPGFAKLDKRMRTASYRISLKRGEGYLINDRIWMHGRTMTSRSVTRNRLHRLVF